MRPHAPTHIGNLTYSYDANGNQLGWTHDDNGTRRNIVWVNIPSALTVLDALRVALGCLLRGEVR